MRICGECTVCCYIGAVPELHKPAHRQCKYQLDGCMVFGREERPTICSAFKCAWLHGHGESIDRPDKSKVFISISNFNGGTWIFIVELAKNAILKTGRNIILDIVRKIDFPAIIINYDSLPPNDKGDRTAIKQKLLKATKRMRGKYLTSLSKDIKIFELVTS